MTKTRAKQTITPTTTPDGRDGYRIECGCATHPQGMNAAIVPTYGRELPISYVHGKVLNAHNPALGPALTRAGKSWKA